MSDTILSLAKEMADQFERRKRDNGDTFYALKNGKPDWMQDVCHKAHGGMFPDDYRYSVIAEAIDYIVENNLNDSDDINEMSFEFADNVDVYNSDLIDWLGSHGERVGYVDEATNEFGHGESLMQDIMRGQFREREETFNLVAQALKSMAD